jgi:uncharacterized protein YndB with AHSA1/START domain
VAGSRAVAARPRFLSNRCRERPDRSDPVVRARSRCRSKGVTNGVHDHDVRGQGISRGQPMEREIVLTRVVDAPRGLVFDAWTKPELLKRWYGPRGWSLVVCEIDLGVGGVFRFVPRRAGGKDVGQRGVHHEIGRPERFVHTESWKDWGPRESLIAPLRSSRAARPRSRPPCSTGRSRFAIRSSTPS